MINYAKQNIDKKDILSVVKTLKSSFLTQGPEVTNFEKKIKKYLGAKYTCVVNSGTAALHLAILALKIKPKDVVITTPITFLASSNVILYAKAKPYFVDIDPNSYCICTQKLEENLIKLKKKGKKVKAVIVTDYAGQPANWKKIKELSKKFNFKTINDNCHSLGSRYNGKKNYATNYADIATHSYHPAKIITTGEGGSLSTNKKEYYENSKLLKSHGVIRSKKLKKLYGNWYYQMSALGYNYRLPDINCSLGVSQLNKINRFLKERKSIAKIYQNEFENLKNFTTPEIKKNCEHAFHLYVLKINFEKIKISKKTLFEKLLKKKISLQVHYIPIHLQKYYKKNFNYKNGDFPVAESFYKNAVSLPIYPGLSREKIFYVCREIKKLCK
jgi:UDP-4-amino-4,6-dideoxy-N-acetyl-beta-L-altrosamine transaminase